MKIEKISDSQIRCTLNRQDLAERQLRLSELAYGSEKAKELFRDMMLQASYECGFEAEDIPLMIEAIPISAESLVLVVTKVEDPDELDTRLSSFSPYREKSDDTEDDDDSVDALLEEFLDNIDGNKKLSSPPDNNSTFADLYSHSDYAKVFSFSSLKSLVSLAVLIAPHYFGDSSLYRNHKGIYYLTISKSEHTPEEFMKICNTAFEHSIPTRTTYASLSYYREHCQTVIEDNAVQVLSML